MPSSSRAARGWVCGLILFFFWAGPVWAVGPHDAPPGLERAVEHLCVEVLHGQSPDPELIAPLLAFVRSHADASLGLPKFRGAPGAYQGFPIHLPMQRLLRYLYNPQIPQEIVKPFSIRSSVWTTPGAAEEQRRLWAHWPPAEPVVIRGEQYDRTTPDPATGGCYGMRLQRVIVSLPLEKAVLSVSVQPEPSEVGRKGYALGTDGDGRYVYSGEEGLTRAGLGWVSSRIQTNVSIGVYLEGEDGSVKSGVFQWMRAGWSGLSVVKESHVAASLVRYRALLTAALNSALPAPEHLEALFMQVGSLSEESLRDHAQDVFRQWLAQAGQEKSLPAVKLLEDGYSRRLDLNELIALRMRQTMTRPE